LALLAALSGAAPAAHAVWGDVATPAEIMPFEHVSIVLASRNLRSPVSQFGHTFLVFHHHDRPEPSAIAVEYSGRVESWDDYILTLFGEVSGSFSVQYYSYKIRDYELEDRSYWVYPLSLPTAQVQVLKADMVSAIGKTSTYGVFRENCASYLIEALAQAAGRSYASESVLFVTPDATVRWLQREHLIGDAIYEPSMLMRARAAYRALDRDEQASVRGAIAGYAPDGNVGHPRVADAISRYADFRIIRAGGPQERELLFSLKKSHAEMMQTAMEVDPDAVDPSRSPGNASAGIAQFAGAQGTRIWLRPGFIGPENQSNYGIANAVSAIFQVQLRAARSLTLEAFDVLDTASYAPGGFLGSSFTQRLTIGYRDYVSVLGTRQRETALEFGRGTSRAMGPFTLSLLPFASVRGVWAQSHSDTEARMAGRARIYAGLAKGLGASLTFDRYLNPRLGIAQRAEGRIDWSVNPSVSLSALVRGVNGWRRRHEVGAGVSFNF
jgi:hypothetical protein